MTWIRWKNFASSLSGSPSWPWLHVLSLSSCGLISVEDILLVTLPLLWMIQALSIHTAHKKVVTHPAGGAISSLLFQVSASAFPLFSSSTFLRVQRSFSPSHTLLASPRSLASALKLGTVPDNGDLGGVGHCCAWHVRVSSGLNWIEADKNYADTSKMHWKYSNAILIIQVNFNTFLKVDRSCDVTGHHFWLRFSKI